MTNILNHFHCDVIPIFEILYLYGLVARVSATDPEVQVRFPALSDFLRSSGSGTGSIQRRE
jgi:hypothetical protein